MNDARNNARDYFKSCGLSYKDINITTFYVLRAYVSYMLIEFNKKYDIDELKMAITPEKSSEFISDSSFKFGQVNVSGSYFPIREAITFNEDGFIGFAGWADSDNVQPFIDAFLMWCDMMKENKGAYL
jgi:hypothetical protein